MIEQIEVMPASDSVYTHAVRYSAAEDRTAYIEKQRLATSHLIGAWRRFVPCVDGLDYLMRCDVSKEKMIMPIGIHGAFQELIETNN